MNIFKKNPDKTFVSFIVKEELENEFKISIDETNVEF